MSDSNGSDWLLREWCSIAKQHPEELALARVSVDINSLAESLAAWVELHTKRVEAGELPANDTILPINYFNTSTIIDLLEYLIKA